MSVRVPYSASIFRESERGQTSAQGAYLHVYELPPIPTMNAAPVPVLARLGFDLARCAGYDVIRTMTNINDPTDNIRSPIRGEAGTECYDESDSPAPTAAASDGSPPEIQNYRLLQRVGEGGMGEVFEAEQLQPVRRRVAIKVIRHGVATKDVIARFEAERQALALMSHSAIAKIFDAGATRDGRPFFAMEFVKGLNIASFCDQQRLSVRDRLELFIKVCQGVQHAHQKGIVHRDIKPTNVLVCLENATPVPKIIDFGVAKATTLPLTDLTLYTSHGQIIGTPAYMSPEQADPSGLDVDTRSDVYSLGMLLYVLLVGDLPFATGKAGVSEIRRLICEDEPPRPSTNFGRHSHDTEQTSHLRRTGRRELRKELKGDLDWIVMKALEKERDRRYETVDALAMDVRHHLEHEPVRAARPSTTYRLGKLVRRHRLGATLTVMMGVLIITSATTMAILATRANRERHRANLEAATATEVSDFLVDLFEVVDPGDGRGKSVTVREVLDAGARQVEHRLGDQPLVRARLLDAIGRAYLGLGMGDAAEPMLEQSFKLRSDRPDASDADTAASLVSLSRLREHQGRSSDQEDLARQAVEICERRFGPDDARTAEALHFFGWALMSQDRFDDAEPIIRRTLRARQTALEADHPDLAESLFDLGYLLWRTGRYDEAEPPLVRSVALFEESLGPNHFRVRKGLDTLAALCLTLGRLDEAEQHFSRSLVIREKELGPESREVGAALSNLGVLVDAQGRSDEAAEMLERSVSIYANTVGENHQEYAAALGNLAWVRSHQGRLEEAQSLYLEALVSYQASVGDDHTHVATLLRDYAELLIEVGDLDEAMTAAQRSLEIRREALDDDHLLIADSMKIIAEVHYLRGQVESAARSLSQAVMIFERALGPDHQMTVGARERLSEVQREIGSAPE